MSVSVNNGNSSCPPLRKPNFLDLGRRGSKRVNHGGGLLESPDLKKMCLTTPELDSMVLQLPTTLPSTLASNSGLTPVVDKTSSTPLVEKRTSLPERIERMDRNERGERGERKEDDVVKLERKRERNRQAAAKCRNKKIQRINELEAKKAQLAKEKETLMESIQKQKDEIEALRLILMEHIKSGCNKNLLLNAKKASNNNNSNNHNNSNSNNNNSTTCNNNNSASSPSFLTQLK